MKGFGKALKRQLGVDRIQQATTQKREKKKDDVKSMLEHVILTGMGVVHNTLSLSLQAENDNTFNVETSSYLHTRMHTP